MERNETAPWTTLSAARTIALLLCLSLTAPTTQSHAQPPSPNGATRVHGARPRRPLLRSGLTLLATSAFSAAAAAAWLPQHNIVGGNAGVPTSALTALQMHPQAPQSLEKTLATSSVCTPSGGATATAVPTGRRPEGPPTDDPLLCGGRLLATLRTALVEGSPNAGLPDDPFSSLGGHYGPIQTMPLPGELATRLGIFGMKEGLTPTDIRRVRDTILDLVRQQTERQVEALGWSDRLPWGAWGAVSGALLLGAPLALVQTASIAIVGALGAVGRRLTSNPPRRRGRRSGG
jgi:hypothetical protein